MWRSLVRKLCLAAAIVLAGLTTNARAGTYDLDFTAAGGSGFPTYGDLVITTGAADSGGYDVTGITGTDSFGTVTGPLTDLGSDNILYPTGNPFDGSGIEFGDSGSASNEFQLVLDFGSDAIIYADTEQPVSITSFGPASSTPVPEPATLAVLATGLVGIVAGRRLTVRSIVAAAGLARRSERERASRTALSLAIPSVT
jgi:hypothetical protein